MKKKRGARGEAHGHSKLTEAQVNEIYIRAWEGEKQIALGAEYNICQQQVSKIKINKRWQVLGLGTFEGKNND